MPKSGPILIVEDDHDDQELLKEVFNDLIISNTIRFFSTCLSLLDYLKTTIERPFLIICDINVPQMDGLELRKEINENEFLRKKSIPFIFLTTTSTKSVIEEAYEMMVQGYFVKPNSIQEIKETIKMIIDYWKVCRHPNTEI
jgi:CheY-like chemotaxis protein